MNDELDKYPKQYSYYPDNEVLKKQRGWITENLVDILHKRNLWLINTAISQWIFL